MPKPLFTIEVAGDVQVSRGFSRFVENVEDLREPYAKIAMLFWAANAEQFETEGRHGSGGWEPLQATTIERKARGGFSNRIMVREGRLETSLTTGNADTIEEIGKTEMRLGTRTPYAIYQHKGTPSTGMPARPLIALTEADKREMTRELQRHLVKDFRKGFAGLMPQQRAGEAALRSIR